MTHFSLPPRAAGTPCLALLTLLPTLALIPPVQMCRMTTGKPQQPSRTAPTDAASNPQRRDWALGEQPHDP